MSRRTFVLGLSLFAAAAAFAADPCANAPNTCQDLRKPGEIVRDPNTATLQGVVDLRVETRSVIDYDTGKKQFLAPRNHVLRGYHGAQGFVVPDKTNDVVPSGTAAPGPTLRARVGDTVQLVFLNRIDPSQFPATSITSKKDKCDTSFTQAGPLYPSAADEAAFPNCFHASNTSNMHYHGTHVTPGGFGDNVLIGVLPNKSIDVDKAIAESKKVFAAPEESKKEFIAVGAAELARMRDEAKARGDNELAEQLQTAIDTNEHNVDAGEWPQYWPGFYPYTFKLPAASGTTAFPVMGQAPGTHWYHAHQHGSTTTQLLNGMAGLFIITGDYDDKILALGGGTPEKPKIAEKVMILQLYQEQPNLVFQSNATTVKTITAVNGQVVPKVTMKKGEVQWWRLANAAVKANGSDNYLFISQEVYDGLTLATPNPPYTKGSPPFSKTGSIPRFYQTALDGVQFDYQNYTTRSTPTIVGDTERTVFPLAPGNRADILVQAPTTEGTSYLIFWPNLNVTGGFNDINRYVLAKVVVKGEAKDVNTSLPGPPGEPSTDNPYPYPTLPTYLANIDPNTIKVSRTLTFSMDKDPPGTGNSNPNDTRVQPPNFFIDGKRFSEGIIDQVMLLGGAEEWTVRNTSLSGVSHPFHIHVNPFQIAEIYDPALPVSATNGTPLTGPLVWADTLSVPASVKDANGNLVVGYVKIRSRFVDFPGTFVLHCHILGHEDRGMMQMVRVVDNKTVVKHH